MTYDSTRSRVVLFGGDPLSNLLGDTWVWDGSFWTQIDDIGPAPRRDSALVYDTARQVAILFGGRSAQGALGDTWQWDGAEWTQLSESGPAARFTHAMAFDSTRNRTVLFGGSSGAASLSDTWEFDGQDWTQQEDTGPSARAAHSMTFDSTNARVVLFGGADAGSKGLGDTWGWSGSAWQQIAEFGPPNRLGAAMVAMNTSLVLFGGVSTNATEPPAQVFADTWEFDGKHWTQRQDIGPGPRRDLAMAFDSGRNRVVLFGGLRLPPAAQIDVAALSGETWEHAGDQPAPPPPPPGNLAVASIQPSFSNGALTVVINLNGPAPSGGADVLVTVAAQGTIGTPAHHTIAAGSTSETFTLEVPVLPPGGLLISAQCGNTPAVSVSLAN